jgi:hypothetical protein
MTIDTTTRDGPVPELVPTPTDDVVVARGRDKVRAATTYWLLGLFSLVLLGAGLSSILPVGLKDDKTPTLLWTQGKEFMNIALPSVTGLLGTVIGFYFGSRTDGARSGSGSGASASR